MKKTLIVGIIIGLMLPTIIGETPVTAIGEDYFNLNVRVFGYGENCPEEDLTGIEGATVTIEVWDDEEFKNVRIATTDENGSIDDNTANGAFPNIKICKGRDLVIHVSKIGYYPLNNLEGVRYDNVLSGEDHISYTIEVNLKFFKECEDTPVLFSLLNRFPIFQRLLQLPIFEKILHSS